MAFLERMHTAVLVLALTLLAHSQATEPPSLLPRPRVHVYQMPEHLTLTATSEVGVHPGTVLLDRLLRSPYYEPDPAKADYFWVPVSGRIRNRAVLVEVLRYIREEQPWFNMTVQQGTARHIMVMTRDSDPGETFGWPLNQSSYPLDVNPASASRNLIFLSFNGMGDGTPKGKDHCVVCFEPGKDIMIPKFQGICNGPLCGVNIQSEVTRRRKKLLFFGGSSLNHHDFTGRGGAALFYGKHKRYLIQVSQGTQRSQWLSFHEAMLNSEFCLSPLGGNGGPTDRYVPGVMFGCIPVMLNSSHTLQAQTPHALPLEEVLPWHKFATVIDNWNMAGLDAQLQCLAPRIPEMRAALKDVWPSLVYSSLYRHPFLNETGRNDAFHTLMRVLASRIPFGYKPSSETRKRLAHPGSVFPCLPDSPPEKGQGAAPA